METSVIVGLLIIAGIWSVYLLPVVFGDRRDAPLSSTEEFDRWSHSIANVQKHSTAELASSSRDVVRQRRRRTLWALAGLTTVCLFLAWRQGSMPWLLAGLFFASLIALYLVLLTQMRQRRDQRLKVTHVAERPTEWEEPQVRVIAR
jgi:peptidoglycan/LPS O-acetylase OafA/YrhL